MRQWRTSLAKSRGVLIFLDRTLKEIACECSAISGVGVNKARAYTADINRIVAEKE